MTDEPVTVYGLMFDPPADWTLGQLSAAFRTIPIASLFQAAALVAVVGPAFDRAFGADDMRTTTVANALGPIGMDLERRGHVLSAGFNIKTTFEDWRATMAAGGPGG